MFIYALKILLTVNGSGGQKYKFDKDLRVKGESINQKKTYTIKERKIKIKVYLKECLVKEIFILTVIRTNRLKMNLLKHTVYCTYGNITL